MFFMSNLKQTPSYVMLRNDSSFPLGTSFENIHSHTNSLSHYSADAQELLGDVLLVTTSSVRGAFVGQCLKF